MKRFMVDFLKVLILMVLVGVMLYLADPANLVVFQAMGIGIFLVGGTHFTRRILFHRLDLQSIAIKAVEEKNIAAALIFAAIMAFLVTVMVVSMSILK